MSHLLLYLWLLWLLYIQKEYDFALLIALLDDGKKLLFKNYTKGRCAQILSQRMHVLHYVEYVSGFVVDTFFSLILR